MSEFADKLAALTAAEMCAAHGDADRIGAVIERLAAALGFSIGMASRGDPKTIDEMIAGAERYAHEEAVHTAGIARFMADARNSTGLPPRSLDNGL